MNLSPYFPVCEALVELMHPLIEIVIHDIVSDKIVYIKGSLSQRKVGDPSLLDKESLKDVKQIVYPKINFDGKLVKSISVVLENQWVMCINCDLSIFNKMQELSHLMFPEKFNTQPESLFVNDWKEKIHISIHDYLQKHTLSFDHLRNIEKKAIVQHLYEVGAFKEKNAADYIAKILSLGRATVFKYLKEMRKE